MTRGIVSIGLVIMLVALLAMGGGGYYILTQPSVSPSVEIPSLQDIANSALKAEVKTETKTQESISQAKPVTSEYVMYRNNELQFSARIPASWVVTTAENPRVLFMRSADYEPAPRSQQMGSLDEVAQGAQIMIPFDHDVLDAGIQNPDAYVQFKMGLFGCTNCISQNVITFGGQPAVMGRFAYGDAGDFSIIQFAHGGTGWVIGYTYDSFSAERKAALDEFIKSFTFTEMTKADTTASPYTDGSLTVSTRSGRAPLTVTYSIQQSAGGQSVDFGDGTNPCKPMMPGFTFSPESGCTAPAYPQTFTHTYTRPGMYTVTASRLMPSVTLGSAVITVTQ